MYLFCEAGIRGGVSSVFTRYAKANNPSVRGYDPSKPQTHLIFFDCVNLYGAAMKELLPCGGFKWESPISQLFHPDNIIDLDENSERGYIFDVNLTIPPERHDYLNQYPPAAENIEIHEGIISPYSREVRKLRGYPKKFSQRKLCPNLLDKEHFVVHIQALKCYLKLGVKVTRINRIMSFKQKAWLKEYVNLRSERRSVAGTEFLRKVEKLGVVSVFGKTLENKRKHKTVRFVSNEVSARFQTSKPEFRSFKIISKNLVSVELDKKRVTLDAPIPVGLTKLDISKKKVFDFFYGVILPKFPHAELVLSDTDSLLVKLHTDNITRDLHSIKQFLDLSNLKTSNPLHSNHNKDIPGTFKLETKDEIIEEVVALRSKLYSIRMVGGRKIAAAGVSRKIAAKKITHEDFVNTLVGKKDKFIMQRTIRSDRHTLNTVQSNRIALTAYDDKRYILDDGIHTLAYGHNRIH